MRWPRPRFTLRRLMIGVALAAVAIRFGPHHAAGWLQRRSDRLQSLHDSHALTEWDMLDRAVRQSKVGWGTSALGLPEQSETPIAVDWLEARRRKAGRYIVASGDTPPGSMYSPGHFIPTSRLVRHAEYHRRLKLKYRFALRYPWLPVAPDPPPPVP